MLTGAIYGLLAALVIFMVTYAQAANDREFFGETEATLRLNPLPLILIIIICVIIGAILGATYHG
jgi:ABC-type xylose transport system permease subunit